MSTRKEARGSDPASSPSTTRDRRRNSVFDAAARLTKRASLAAVAALTFAAEPACDWNWDIPTEPCMYAVEGTTNTKASLIQDIFNITGESLTEEVCNAWYSYSEEFVQRLRDIAVLLDSLGIAPEDISTVIRFVITPYVDEIVTPLPRSLTSQEQTLLNNLIGNGEDAEIRYGNVNYVLYWAVYWSNASDGFDLGIGCSRAEVSNPE